MEVTTYITKGAPFFSGGPLLRTPLLSVLVGGQSLDGRGILEGAGAIRLISSDTKACQ